MSSTAIGGICVLDGRPVILMGADHPCVSAQLYIPAGYCWPKDVETMFARDFQWIKCDGAHYEPYFPEGDTVVVFDTHGIGNAGAFIKGVVAMDLVVSEYMRGAVRSS